MIVIKTITNNQFPTAVFIADIQLNTAQIILNCFYAILDK